jgi:hypothetical protein
VRRRIQYNTCNVRECLLFMIIRLQLAYVPYISDNETRIRATHIKNDSTKIVMHSSLTILLIFVHIIISVGVSFLASRLFPPDHFLVTSASGRKGDFRQNSLWLHQFMHQFPVLVSVKSASVLGVL